MKSLFRLLSTFLLLTLTWGSCFSSAVIAQDSPPKIVWKVDLVALQKSLRRREGIVLIDTEVKRPVGAWRMQGELPSVSPELGRNVTAIVLPAGEYQWDELSIPHFNLPHRKELQDLPEYAFTVERQAINYFGTLFVGADRGTDSVDVRLLNRSAELVLSLREMNIELPETLPLVYAGKLEDQFIKRFGLLQPAAQP